MQIGKHNGINTALETFLATPLDELLEDGKATAPLALFRQVVTTVPAYRAFLRDHGIDPESIKSKADFQRLPLITKKNYLKLHSMDSLCRNGDLNGCDMIAVSSGSTGQPTFWPRTVADEFAVAVRFEQIFHDTFYAEQRRTLAVVCFPMGNWVGGMYTASCCRWLACKGYKITLAAPGNQPSEILRVVRELGPNFDQVVLLGYPPFLKGVIDQGIAEEIDWSSLNVRMVFAGEVFSEEWRSLVAHRISSTEPSLDFASLYGTADAGVLGNETPLSIRIRQYLARHPDAARQLFGESRLPTLVQYDPKHRYFETEGGTLIFSADGGVPLVRYHIADSGGILAYEEVLHFLGGFGFDPRVGLERGVRPLPFVYVFGRADFTVSFYGANVYPENVSIGLEQPGIAEWVSGKFVLQVREDADRNLELHVMVEMAPGQAADESRRVAASESIRAQLVRLNSEFANYVPTKAQLPQVELRPSGDPEYFPVGIKHRYTRR
ncbi:phenylacetate--CoA ligase family protein [Gloeobacter violaceus]|nr:phenylacetate--CoA ligase family protein [Gloeobacter violaceus]